MNFRKILSLITVVLLGLIITSCKKKTEKAYVLTFKVQAPEGTQKLYVSGNFNKNDFKQSIEVPMSETPLEEFEKEEGYTYFSITRTILTTETKLKFSFYNGRDKENIETDNSGKAVVKTYKLNNTSIEIKEKIANFTKPTPEKDLLPPIDYDYFHSVNLETSIQIVEDYAPKDLYIYYYTQNCQGCTIIKEDILEFLMRTSVVNSVLLVDLTYENVTEAIQFNVPMPDGTTRKIFIDGVPALLRIDVLQNVVVFLGSKEIKNHIK